MQCKHSGKTLDRCLTFREDLWDCAFTLFESRISVPVHNSSSEAPCHFLQQQIYSNYCTKHNISPDIQNLQIEVYVFLIVYEVSL